jgi:hypothetical protein
MTHHGARPAPVGTVRAMQYALELEVIRCGAGKYQPLNALASRCRGSQAATCRDLTPRRVKARVEAIPQNLTLHWF